MHLGDEAMISGFYRCLVGHRRLVSGLPHTLYLQFLGRRGGLLQIFGSKLVVVRAS